MEIKYPLTAKARRSGTGWVDICPSHDDREPSLSIGLAADGKLLLHCFAGCTFDAIVAAARLTGLPPAHRPTLADVVFREKQHAAEQRAKRDAARRIWEEGSSLPNTQSAIYLAGRGLSTDSPTLRHHVKLWNAEQNTHCPALLAAVRLEDRFVGVHRTYLSEDGGKLTKRMLGACKGGAAQLRPYGGNLIVAEGIETTLSTMALCDREGFGYWAALSASGMGALMLPKTSGTLVIAADGDRIGLKAAEELANRASLAGWSVTIKAAPEGQDWNDVLMEARCE